MPLPVFNFKVDANTAVRTNTYRTKSVQFGEGYKQLAPAGINNKLDTWSLTLPMLSDLDVALVEAFFDPLGQHKNFNWTPPRGTVGIYRLTEPIKYQAQGLDRLGTTRTTVTLSIERSYNYSSTAQIPTDISVNPESFDENTLNPALTLGATNATNPIYTLVSGTGSTNNGSFTIIGNNLIFNNTANFENKSSYAIRVRVTNASGEFYEKPLTIGVNDLNEAPTALTVAGLPISIRTGPTFGATSTYTISGNDNIVQDVYGQISVGGGGGIGGGGGGIGGGGGGGGGSAGLAQFTDNVTGEQFTAILLLENNPNPTVVANLGNNDPDAVVASTYTLINGIGDSDNSVFSISGSDLIINITTDYEIKKEYYLRLRVTTDGGLFTDLPLRVNVVQIPEYPNDILLSSDLIDDLGASIGTLSTIDPDNFSSFTYSIEGGSLAEYLSINGSSLKLDAPIDGMQLGFDILIRATDGTELYIQKPFILTYQSNTTIYQPLNTAVTATYIPVVVQSQTVLVVENIPTSPQPSPYNHFTLQN